MMVGDTTRFGRRVRGADVAAAVILVALISVLIAVGHAWGRATLADDVAAATEACAQAEATLAEAQDALAKASDEAEGLRLLLREAETSATARAERDERVIEQLSAHIDGEVAISETGTVTVTPPRPEQERDPKPDEVSSAAPSAAAWTRAQVAAELERWARHYTLSAADTAWVVETGCRIAYRESTYRPDARNGEHAGLFQFSAAWGPLTSRLDPSWSCRRFVKAYAEGGRANIAQHWAATI